MAILGQQKKQAESNNPFAGISEVKLKRSYLTKGSYVLKVVQCNSGNLPDELGGRFFFGVDFEVVESDNGTRSGADMSWMTQLYPKGRAAFLRDVKGFIAAALNASPKDVTEEDATDATDVDNPLQGKTLLAEVTDDSNINPKTGVPYRKVRFSAIPPAANR